MALNAASAMDMPNIRTTLAAIEVIGKYVSRAGQRASAGMRYLQNVILAPIY
jgi:hypothetical protein